MPEELSIEKPYGTPKFPQEYEELRMWMVNPKWMCHRHLLGEHRELHAIMGCLRIENGVQGYIDNNLIEITNIIPRHEVIVKEMKVRGYKHRSPIIETPNIGYLPQEHIDYKVDRRLSAADLYSRCKMCAWRSYLFYTAWYDLLDAFYVDTVTVFQSKGIWGLHIREDIEL